jgi:hypothetical protein
MKFKGTRFCGEALRIFVPVVWCRGLRVRGRFYACFIPSLMGLAAEAGFEEAVRLDPNLLEMLQIPS